MAIDLATLFSATKHDERVKDGIRKGRFPYASLQDFKLDRGTHDIFENKLTRSGAPEEILARFR